MNVNSADELGRSYDWCYRVARGSGSSFYRAFWLLDRPQRNAMFALYAFARITDDLSDAPSDAERQPAVQIERLNAWRRLLGQRVSASAAGFPAESASSNNPHHLVRQCADAPYAGREYAAPQCAGSQCAVNACAELQSLSQYDRLWPALQHTVQTYHVPIRLLEDLIAGVAMDLQPVRMATWSEVDRYCYHVASTVGLACTAIWQADDALPLQQAIDCGVAFQLTNILRDVREDAARNRIYLPLNELEKFDCDVDSWLAGAPRGDWIGLVSSAVERARALYRSGAGTVDHLPPRSARMFALMWSSYRQLLEAVDRQKANLWTARRARVPTGQRWKLLACSILGPTSFESLTREC